MLALRLQGGLSESQTLTWRQIRSVSSRCVVRGLSRTLSSTGCVPRRDEESAFIASAMTQGAGTWGGGQGMRGTWGLHCVLQVIKTTEDFRVHLKLRFPWKWISSAGGAGRWVGTESPGE